MRIVHNVFNETEIGLLQALPEVKQAQQRLSTQTNVYFDAKLPETLQQRFQDTFGFDLGTKRIPFRWIRGDTAPHRDRGSSSFENTYLVYLTNGEGEFQIGEDSYPITAGTGFVFPEGVEHEVTGANETSRLLLGPMNELGNPVGGGGTNISADGSTTTVYIRQIDGNSQYSTDQATWQTIVWPVYVTNTNGTPASNILKVLFTTDLTLTTTNDYIYVSSDGIQIGDTAVNANGTKRTITLDTVEGYGGFVNNNGYNSIFVYNLKISAVGGSNLSGGSGWVGRQSYGTDGTNNYIIGCSSDGPIPNDGGGIVGGEAATVSVAESADLTIVGCTSSGTIASNAGGIAGEYCGQNNGSTVTILKCSSSGTIGQDAGGIVGPISGQGGSSCVVRRCYSTGTIGTNAGGIFGRYAGDAGQSIAEYCYSRGTIGTDAGAIFGRDGAPDGTTIATNCYGIGSGGEEGIYGTGASEGASSSNCYIAPGSWSDTNAIAAGLSLTNYISTGINTPYELRNIGPSPYSLTTVDEEEEDMTLTYSQSVAAGSSSSASVIFGVSSFSILAIDGESPAETPTITINSTTGAISTTSSTSSGTYAIIVRAVTNPYSITTFTLTVTEAPAPAPTATGSLNTKGKQFDIKTYNDLQQGQRFVIERIERPNLRFNSFADYNNYLKAQASFQK